MKRIIHVKAQDVDVAAMFADPPAKDANLMACLAYLIVSSREAGVITTTEMAKAYNVSDFTVLRWVKRLSELRLLVVSVSVDGQITVSLRLKGNGNGSKEGVSAALGGTEPEVLSKNASASPPLPPTGNKYNQAISISQKSRLDQAVETYLSCRIIHVRSDFKAIEKFLTNVVTNPMFDKVDLKRELLDAEAFLVRKPYRDMVKYLSNWFRRAAKAKRPLKNVNAVPAGKYDALQRAAGRA